MVDLLLSHPVDVIGALAIAAGVFGVGCVVGAVIFMWFWDRRR